MVAASWEQHRGDDLSGVVGGTADGLESALAKKVKATDTPPADLPDDTSTPGPDGYSVGDATSDGINDYFQYQMAKAGYNALTGSKPANPGKPAENSDTPAASADQGAQTVEPAGQTGTSMTEPSTVPSKDIANDMKSDAETGTTTPKSEIEDGAVEGETETSLGTVIIDVGEIGAG